MLAPEKLKHIIIHMHTTDDRIHFLITPRPCPLTLVDLAKDYNTRELCLGVVGNLRVESEDAHAATILSGDILVGFLDQHFGGVGMAL